MQQVLKQNSQRKKYEKSSKRMKFRITPLILGSLLSVLGQDNSCNVQEGDLELVALTSGGFNGLDLSFAPPSARNGGSVRLFEEDDGGSITSFWFEDLFRLSDGFRAVFEYDAVQGNTDGLAFVVQSDKTVDTASSGGAALGYRSDLSGLENYLAVAIDFCDDRSADTCDDDVLRIDSKTNDGNNVLEASIDVSDLGLDSGTHIIQVDYLDNLNTLEVFVDDVVDPVLTATGIDLETILGSKFGFFGFSGSSSDGNGDITPAVIDVESLELLQMNSGFRLDEDSLERQVVDFGAGVEFTVLVVDSCNDQVPAGSVDALEENQIEGFLIDESGQVDPLTLRAVISDNEITLDTTTVLNLETTYTLEIKIDGVLVQENPVVGSVSTVIPSNGLSPIGIGLLGGLLALLVIVVVAIVYGVKKYRAQLIEHKDDIDHGKTKQKIQKIEKDIEYNLNPMVAPLDELKEKLAQNEKKIEQLKAEQKNAKDNDFHVAQLQKENDGLRAEMADLKKRKEFGDVGNTVGNTVPKKTFAGTTDKADFDQEEV